MKILLKFFLALLAFSGAILIFPLIAFATEITDTQAATLIMDTIQQIRLDPLSVSSGILILSLFMTLLKWPRFGRLFDEIPKKYRSFIPIGAGGLIGVFQVLAGGVTAPLLIFQGFITGLVTIGGGQQVIYQQLKGTWLGELLALTFRTKSQRE